MRSCSCKGKQTAPKMGEGRSDWYSDGNVRLGNSDIIGSRRVISRLLSLPIVRSSALGYDVVATKRAYHSAFPEERVSTVAMLFTIAVVILWI